MHRPCLRDIAHSLDTSRNRLTIIVVANIAVSAFCDNWMGRLADLASVIGCPSVEQLLLIIADISRLIIFRFPLFIEHCLVECQHSRILVIQCLPGSGICFEDFNRGMVVLHDSPLYLPGFQYDDLHIAGSHIAGLCRCFRLPQNIVARCNMVNPVRFRCPDWFSIFPVFQIPTVIVFVTGYPLLLDSGISL